MCDHSRSPPLPHEMTLTAPCRNGRFRNPVLRPVHSPAHQNRKYRCAIGSTSAGSQVKSSPSARTS